MKKRQKDSTALRLKVGSAEADPQEVLRHKRLMKGAKRRMATHNDKADLYRIITKERAVQRISKDGKTLTINLGEPEVYEYRMRRYKEQLAYMAAKRDYEAHRDQYEALVGSNTAELREILQSERATIFASRNARRYAGIVMGHLRKGDANGTSTIQALLPLTGSGHRKEFRSGVQKFVGGVDPETAELFEKKPKLFSRVVERLAVDLNGTNEEN